MAVDIANMVEDDCQLFVNCRPEHPANLLQVKAKRLGRSEQDGAACCGDVKALGDHINGHQHLQLTGCKALD